MHANELYEGIITALVTPFKGGVIDAQTLSLLTERQIESGIKAVVIAGSTGDGNSINLTELKQIITTIASTANGRLQLIASISCASLNEAKSLLAVIEKAGCINGLMCTMPHYVRPSDEGVIAYFKELAASTNLPIMLYSNKLRTGTGFSKKVIKTLAQIPNIVGYKDAEGNIAQLLEFSMSQPYFNILAGDDQNIIPYSASGGKGGVSVLANLIPKEMLQIQLLLKQNNYQAARNKLKEIWPLMQAINLNPNPAGIKYAMHLAGLCSAECRLPMTIPQHDAALTIKQEMANLGLIAS